MENLILTSSKVFLSENENNPDSYFAKFVICDFGENGNNVKLDRSNIENWVCTLKNKPLVGKIKVKFDGTMDFTGHNMKRVVKVDKDGNKYIDAVFDTEAFGSFVDVGIEEIDGVEYITATAEIWKRFENACSVILSRIESGTLNTSWEIATEEYEEEFVDGVTHKTIISGRFIGLCTLGATVQPAYESSKLLEIASKEDDDLSSALVKDIIKEENMAKKKIEVSEETQEILEDVSSKESADEKEVSSLTMYDLRNKVQKACEAKLNDYWVWVVYMFPEEHYVLVEKDGRESELDYVKLTYEVNNDEVTVGEPEDVKLVVSIAEINNVVASKDEALVKANNQIQTLKAEVDALSPFKEAYEQAEKEKQAAEIAQKQESLKSYALKSNQITQAELESDEKIKTMISELDEIGIKALISDRFVASLETKQETNVETSEKEVTPKANLVDDSDEVDYKSAMKKFLSK